MWLFHPTLAAVEYDAVFLHCGLHQLDKVPVMPLWGTAIDAYVVMDDDDTREMVSDLIHAHFKDVLAHLQDKWHLQEWIPPFVGVEHCQI